MDGCIKNTVSEMSPKEAIEVLTNLMPMPIRGDGKSTTHLKQVSALMMAIEALEKDENKEDK